MLGSYTEYAHTLLRIKNKQAKLAPLTRNKIQQFVGEIKQDIKARGRLVRIIMLKGRQFGVSTDQLGENFQRTSTSTHKTAMFVTHEPKATSHLFGIVKRMHENIPLPEWKPGLKYSNASELVFDGIDSAIRVGTAGTDNVGSSQTINYLHLSELPKFPPHSTENILTSILQCVPKSDPDSEVFIEGTAFGVGGKFYDMFWGAKYVYTVFLRKGRPAWKLTINNNAKPDNDYSSIFAPWYCHEEYQMDPELGFTRTKAEQMLVALHGINDRHLKWRRYTIANECLGSEEKFEQEYATTPESAFLGTGRPVFTPTQQISARKKALEDAINAGKDSRKYYECMYGTGQWITAAPEMGHTDGLLQVWEEPRAGAQYVVAADVAEGLEKGDWDSVDVVDQLTGRQVAHWHGHTAPDQLAILLYHIGHRYNVACVAPERNNHGLTTVSKLFNDLNYPNLYVEEVDDPPHKKRKRYGWHTTSANKPLAIDGLAADFRQTPGNINCVETLGEMLSFKHNNDGSMEAESGRFDDRVMSLAIANHVRKTLALPSSTPAPTPSGSPVPSSSSASSPGMGAYT